MDNLSLVAVASIHGKAEAPLICLCKIHVPKLGIFIAFSFGEAWFGKGELVEQHSESGEGKILEV